MRDFSGFLSREDCEKCEWKGFSDAGERVPTFQFPATFGGPEFLAWPCPRCDHKILSLTADAKRESEANH
jgi:hypothetical protein